MQVAPEIDRLLGIETYVTQTSGIRGRIRGVAEDFQVEEILADGSKANFAPPAKETMALGATLEQQQHLFCVLAKQNWDTLMATKSVANQLGLGQNSVQIAGIKDAKAVTAQYITIENLKIEEINKINLSGIHVRPVGYLRYPLSVF
ncbi:MAG: tRNA pseudouridine(13) synthase TruD, partial [Nitrososphaerota archaeon]|nr:tRNA pseudouridine(13) synthase TruD [Nitrososphaerota archaeon]